jgi:DNA-binding GntR family transcriptional regulator
VATSAIIDRTSVRAQVRRILGAQVASGQLAPGEIYSAVALANDLGVSATPVREAMLDLANAGLVEPVRNRGFRILTLSREDLYEIVELRLWLEVPAMGLVVERASDRQLDELAPLAHDIVEAAERGALADFLVADHMFHSRLLALTGNARLVRLVQGLRDQTQLLGLKRLGESGKLDRSAREHLDLLAALRSRDAVNAQQLMARHLEHVRGIWAGIDEPAA